MSAINLEDCSHCLGTGEEIKQSIIGTVRARTCKRCKGVGQVEAIVNDHYINEGMDY